MQTILIPTLVSDIHAVGVAVELQRRGHRVIRWFGADFPEVNHVALYPHNLGRSQITVDGAEILLADIDIFWNRRQHDPVIDQVLEISDREIATLESKTFSRNMFTLISETRFSVNHSEYARLADNKLMQLLKAQEVGFTIPRSLFSNQLTRVKEFVEDHAKTEVIYKPHKPAMWKKKNESVALAFTSVVSGKKFPSEPVFRVTPGIFQEKIDKEFEVRVTCMGSHIVAVKLASQAVPAAKLDWRATSPHALEIEVIALPDSVAAACLALLKKMNLLFGCIDLICTKSGDYVFLEINQMGQFLWIEEANPSIHLLDMFCQFLLSKDADFVYMPTENPCSFAEIRKNCIEIIKNDMHSHRFLKSSLFVYEEAQ